MDAWNKCPGCGITTSSVADFCPHCGEAWKVKCPHCEATWRFWKLHMFCPTCGAPVEKPGSIHGKQRQTAQRSSQMKAT